MAEQDINVLIVSGKDPTRRLLVEALEGLTGTRVVDRATDGTIALSKLRRLDVDLVLLDMETPAMDLAVTLAAIREQNRRVGIVVTGPSADSATEALLGLQLGALSFIPRPAAGDLNGVRDLRLQLLPLIGLLRSRRNIATADRGEARQLRALPPKCPVPDPAAGRTSDGAPNDHAAFGSAKRSIRPAKVRALVIAASTGGPNALANLIPNLPADLGIPIFVVQHMPPVLTASLAAGLNAKSKLAVKEAANGDEVAANVVYIAPGGVHMGVKKHPPADGQPVPVIFLSTDPPENGVRPSADVLLRSLMPLYGANVLVAILTGMGSDGLNGVRALKRTGCYCLSQTQDSCVVYGMPRAVDEAGLSDERVGLETMAARISQIVRGG